MLSLPSKLFFWGAVATLGLINPIHAQDVKCETGPIQGFQAVGISDPSSAGLIPFCASEHDVGIPVTGLEVWFDPLEGINAISVEYANGDKSGPYGKPGDGKFQAISWKYSEKFVKRLQLYGNGGGRRLGHIEMELDDGTMFSVGNRDDGRSKKTAQVIEVGAGVILGVRGWGSDNIGQITFLFLKSQIDKIRMSNPVFDDSPENLNAQQKGIDSVLVGYAEHSNNQAVNETFTFGEKKVKTITTTTESTTTHTFGVKVGIEWEAKILALEVKSSVELSYQFSKADSKSTATTDTTEVSWNIAAPVPAGQTVYCKATAKTGTSSLAYLANVDVLLKDGSSWAFSERGTYSQVAWSQAESSCDDKPFSDLPSRTDQGASPTKRAVKFIA